MWFIFAVDQQLACMHVRIYLPASVRAGRVHTAVRALATCQPKHLFRAESFLGGVLLRINHHDVGGTNQIVPLEIVASSSVRVTVNTYFLYVHNTESTNRDILWYRYGKYREIPTDTDQKIPIWYTTLVLREENKSFSQTQIEPVTDG